MATNNKHISCSFHALRVAVLSWSRRVGLCCTMRMTEGAALQTQSHSFHWTFSFFSLQPWKFLMVWHNFGPSWELSLFLHQLFSLPRCTTSFVWMICMAIITMDSTCKMTSQWSVPQSKLLFLMACTMNLSMSATMVMSTGFSGYVFCLFFQVFRRIHAHQH